MSTPLRLTLDEYDRMIERAVFQRDRRIELIHGELRELPLIAAAHRDAVNVLTNDTGSWCKTRPIFAHG